MPQKGHLVTDCGVKLQDEANVSDDKVVAFVAGKNKSADANENQSVTSGASRSSDDEYEFGDNEAPLDAPNAPFATRTWFEAWHGNHKPQRAEAQDSWNAETCDEPSLVNDLQYSLFDVPVKRDAERNWLQAVKDELTSMKENDICCLVERPTDSLPIITNWMFRIKEKEGGKSTRCKARQVVKGFQQKAGLDYSETYTPVASVATTRTVLGITINSTDRKKHLIDCMI